jgi:phenylalanyl-tRNA synthetase beta subunit
VLLQQLYISESEVKPIDETSAEIILNGTVSIGKILKNDSYYAVDIELKKLLPLLKSHPRYQPLPKAAPIKEDLTFQLPEKVEVGTVLKSIQGTNSLVKKVELKDIYNSNYTFTIIYEDQENSLSTETVAPIRKEIVALVTSNYQGSLIGSV